MNRAEMENAMDREEIKGKGEKVKGDVKHAVGRATNNPRLEGEGDADRLAGEVREGFGAGRRKVNEALDDIDDAMNR